MVDMKAPERIWLLYTDDGLSSPWFVKPVGASVEYTHTALHDTTTKLRDELAAEVERLTKENERNAGIALAGLRRAQREKEGRLLAEAERDAAQAALDKLIEAARADAFMEAAGLAKQYEECWPNAAAPDARQDLKDQYRDMAYAARIIKSVILAHINEPQEGWSHD